SQVTTQYAGFATPDGSGNGHHEMVHYNVRFSYAPLQMDLVGVTSSTGTSPLLPVYALAFVGQGHNQVDGSDVANPLVDIPVGPSSTLGSCLRVEAYVWLPSTTETDMKVVGMPGFFTLGIGAGDASGANTYRTIYPELWTSTNQYITLQAGQIPLETWTQLTMTWEQGGSLTAYINGEQVQQIDVGDDPLGNSGSAPQPITLGTSPYTPAWYGFNGILSAVQISTGSSMLDMTVIGSWGLGEGGGSQVFDGSGLDNVGTIQPNALGHAPTWTSGTSGWSWSLSTSEAMP